jgi:hypothetical protein
MPGAGCWRSTPREPPIRNFTGNSLADQPILSVKVLLPIWQVTRLCATVTLTGYQGFRAIGIECEGD